MKYLVPTILVFTFALVFYIGTRSEQIVETATGKAIVPVVLSGTSAAWNDGWDPKLEDANGERFLIVANGKVYPDFQDYGKEDVLLGNAKRDGKSDARVVRVSGATYEQYKKEYVDAQNALHDAERLQLQTQLQILLDGKLKSLTKDERELLQQAILNGQIL